METCAQASTKGSNRYLLVILRQALHGGLPNSTPVTPAEGHHVASTRRSGPSSRARPVTLRSPRRSFNRIPFPPGRSAAADKGIERQL